jgi:hypothetical protein
MVARHCEEEVMAVGEATSAIFGLLLALITLVCVVVAPFILLRLVYKMSPAAAKAKAEAAGYAAPMEWPDYSKRYVGVPPTFTSRALLAERAAMPPFHLWYFSDHYLPQGKTDKRTSHWSSVVDGNRKLGAVGPQMRHYIQHPFRSSNGSRLYLYEVSRAVVDDLNRGPLRTIDVQAAMHPTRQMHTLTLSVGSADGRWPSTITPSVGGGTAEPVGLSPPLAHSPVPPFRPVETDKL